jgi:hypothetical protein
MDATTMSLAALAVAAAGVLALAVGRRDGRAAAHAAAGATGAALLAVGGAGTARPGVACLAAVPLAALWLAAGGRPGVRGAGPAEGVAWVAGLSLLATGLLVPVLAVLPEARVAVPAPGPVVWAACAAALPPLAAAVRRTLREWRRTRRDAELLEFLFAVALAGLAAGGAGRPAVALAAAAGALAVTAPSLADLWRLPSAPREGALNGQAAALGAQAAALARRTGPAASLPVARLAVATGERLGLSPGHLARLAREAVLRDLGARREPGVRAAEVGTGASIAAIIHAAERHGRLTGRAGLGASQALDLQRQDPDGVSPTVLAAMEAALESGLHVVHAPAASGAVPVPHGVVPAAAGRAPATPAAGTD